MEPFFRPKFPEKDSVDVSTCELRSVNCEPLERDFHGRFSFKFGVDQILWHLGVLTVGAEKAFGGG
jgi:hypothetical protein